MKNIVAISGKAGVGKSTLANLIAAETGGQVLAFADALRLAVAEHYGFRHETVFCPVFKSLTFRVGAREQTGREILQNFGMLLRKADPNYWVEQAMLAIEVSHAPVVILDDLRFVEELHACMEHGALLVRLHPYPGWENKAGDHASETALDDITAWDIQETPAFGALGTLAERIAERIGGRAA